MANGRVEKQGPLAGHVRDGRRRYLPELAATGVLHLEDWVRDDLPDLLWPALLLAHSGTEAAQGFVRWQDAALRELEGEIEAEILSDCLDARLTSLARLGERVPQSRTFLRDSAVELGLLPRPVADALVTYPERPAHWLTDGELRDPTKDDLVLLSRALRETARRGKRFMPG